MIFCGSECGAELQRPRPREQTFGRTPSNKPSDKHAGEVIRLLQDEYLSQRQVAKRPGISKTSINEIV